jgi:CBS-domain-containing membrane protein
MLTDRDICMAAYTQGRPLGEIEVASAMAQKVLSCRPTDTISAAMKMLQTNQIHRLPVLDEDGNLVGMLSLADITRKPAQARARGKSDVTAGHVYQTLKAICEPRSRANAVAAGGVARRRGNSGRGRRADRRRAPRAHP